MKQVSGWMALLLVVLVVGGCAKINRIYKKDTGEMPAVPGPPPAEAYHEPTPPGSTLPPVAGDPAPGTPGSPGSVEFVEPAEAAALEMAPPPEPVKPRTYTVKKGDSYWKIAKEVYGQGIRANDIEAANPGINPNALPIGEEILLPE